ncbi:MAG: acetylornithine transaminase [Gemmatimonadaceae bacterium]|nr:acetylornithine transaminase [Gemmatimonadaceae bacterium]
MTDTMTKGAEKRGGTPGVSSPDILGTYKRAPMRFIRGSGVELFDEDEKLYLDFSSGIAVNALGYGDAGMRQVIEDVMESGLIHVSNLYRTEPGERLAHFLVENSFASNVFFCNSGAEANEGAFKFARRWGRTVGTDGKTGIVALRGGFHGRLFASLAATDRPSYRAPFRPLAGGISICERDPVELDAALDGDSVAAVIVEPVQGEGGVRVIETELLRHIRKLTSERGIALIFDEIQCGLGRLGTFMAYERVGVVPDMVTLAKPLAGGLPMGAVLITGEIGETIKPGDHGTTFGGGPMVAAVADYVIRRLAEPALLASVTRNGEWLGERLSVIARRSGRVRAVRGMGYMWGIDVVDPAAEIVQRGWDAGLLIITAGDHTLRLLPPLIMERADLERGLEMLEKILG